MILDYSQTVERVLYYPLASADPREIRGAIQHIDFGWCPFDRRAIHCVFNEYDPLDTPHGGGETLKIWACEQCGWWQLDRISTWENDLRTLEGQDRTQRHAILRRFAIDSLEVPISLLRSHLRNNPEHIYKIAPNRMEVLVQSVFSEFFHCNVEHCGRSHDGGIDLFFIISDKPSFVQVKRRETPEKTESVATIREFLGAILLRGADRGYIVSTAENFSQDAKKAARQAEALGLVETYELIDRARFFDMLDLVYRDEDPPWMKYTREFRSHIEGRKKRIV